jgi:hypothetical protein
MKAAMFFLSLNAARLRHEEFEAGRDVDASHVFHDLFRIAMHTRPAIAKTYGALVVAIRVQG